MSTSVGSGRALNKLAWDKEGNKTAIGSSDGRVYVYDIGEVCLVYLKPSINYSFLKPTAFCSLIFNNHNNNITLDCQS